MSRLWVLPVLGLVATLAIGCSANGEEADVPSNSASPTPTASPSTSSNPSPIPSVAASPIPTDPSWKTYSDDQHGLSIMYPANWYSLPSTSDTAALTISNYDLTKPFVKDQLLLEIARLDNPERLSEEEWLGANRQSVCHITVLSSEPITLGGLQGIQEDWQFLEGGGFGVQCPSKPATMRIIAAAIDEQMVTVRINPAEAATQPDVKNILDSLQAPRSAGIRNVHKHRLQALALPSGDRSASPIQ